MSKNDVVRDGIDLRDWIAGQVLPAVIQIYAADTGAGVGSDHMPKNCAIHAYRIADAMLKARKDTQ